MLRHGCEFLGFGWRPGALPRAPERNISKVKLVPPEIHHLLIEPQNAVARYAHGRRNERRQAVVNEAALRLVDASEQMPDGESVTLASLCEDFAELGTSFFWSAGWEVKPGQ